MAAMRFRRRDARARGAELVEFAIVMPVLLLMMASVVDFAFLFQSYQVTTNAAREGARLALLPGYDANGYATALQRVNDYIATGGARPASATTTITPADVDLGGGVLVQGVRVSITYTHEFLIIGPIVGALNGTFNDSVTFTTSAAMRTELQPPPGP